MQIRNSMAVAMMIGSTLTGVTWSAEGDAEPKGKTYEVEWHTAGGSIHTGINTDGKNPPASVSMGPFTGTFGSGQSMGMFEPVQIELADSTCREGAILAYGAVAGRSIMTFSDSLDQVFLKVTDTHACIYADYTIESHNNSMVTGRTGRFKGATGKMTTHVNQSQSFPEWKGEFNNVVTTTTGTITIFGE